MKTFIFAIVMSCCYPQMGWAYQISAEFLLKNNVSHRKYLRGVTLHQKIKFLEGFYASVPFVCDETIHFQSHEIMRADYDCGGVTTTSLRYKNSLKTIYNQNIASHEFRPPHFLIALFLYKKEDPLIQLMSDFQFVRAEIREPAPDPFEIQEKPEEKKEKPKTEWNIDGTVSLIRLEKVEKSRPEKLEDNRVLLLSSPVNPARQIWFSKNLFLPQKISYNDREIIFRNYRETANQYNRFFRYPQFIEIRESGISGIIIEPQWDRLEVNPKREKDLFNAANIVKERTSSFPRDSEIKTVLEKFINEYR